MQHVFIRPVMVTALAIAVSDWDRECHTMSCRVTYPPAPAAAPVLRDSIDSNFHIRASATGLITAGTFALALDRQCRVNDFDFYTNPGHWTIASLTPAEGASAVLFLEADFDENGRAKGEAEPAAIYDPEHARLCLSWGLANSWYRIAPTLALGLSADGRLMQIRLDDFLVPAKDLV